MPAARPDVIDETNALRLQCKVIIQGANIPCTPQAERILHGRGILSVPDFVANAGGVICASVEYHGGTQKQAFETIEEKIRENTHAVLELARRSQPDARWRLRSRWPSSAWPRRWPTAAPPSWAEPANRTTGAALPRGGGAACSEAAGADTSVRT